MESYLPKIALVGRPNVGKSALFNRLSGRRLSIVDEAEGITRDRLYADAECFGKYFRVIDTAGIDASSKLAFNEEVMRQSELAINEADVVVLVVDGKVGLAPLDHEVAKMILRTGKPAIVAVNKVDRVGEDYLLHQFYKLGIPNMVAVSAMEGTQTVELVEAAFALLPEKEAQEEIISDKPIRVAIAGRPNVGKSTLLNLLLGEERAVVSAIAGTTRDSIDATWVVDGQEVVLIDTAGIRRKKAERESVDKFAAIRTKEAIERSDVVLLIFDAYEGLTTQEKRIASEIEEAGRSCILVFNKWDLVHGIKMEHALRGVYEEVPFLKHCPTIFLSALTGRNADKIFPLVKSVYQERFQRIGTGVLNKFIERCVQKVHPAMLGGKRLRIYYMTQVQISPPRFVFFVNRSDLMMESYKKYLINQFREIYKFSGCPLVFDLRGKKSTLPPPSLLSEPTL
jgi:GTP-binding protein